MSIRKGAIEDLPKMAEPFKDGKILVVFDNHTYEVAGKRAVELLKENGFNNAPSDSGSLSFNPSAFAKHLSNALLTNVTQVSQR